MLSGEVGRKIPTARLGGKETDVATDTAKQLTEQFRTIRQDWDLRANESTTQTHNKALAPLHAWLRNGVDDPEVVIRAVQVLMADPERPGIHKRPAVNHIFKQISDVWENAGLEEQDVHILRGMVLATWPYDSMDDFRLVSHLDSAWMAIHGRLSKEKHFQEWRRQLTEIANEWRADTQHGRSTQIAPVESFSGIQISPLPKKTVIRNRGYHNEEEAVVINTEEALEQLHKTTSALVQQQAASHQAIQQLATNASKLPVLLNGTLDALDALTPQLDLLWWGQSRYSSTTRLPYRRIPDTTQRMWWMAWECSELATNLGVEPSASFLVETLYQLDAKTDDPKRPLKDWVTEFIDAIRRIHENDQHANAVALSSRLEKLAKEDPLGLPVTWARIVAIERKPFAGSVEEHLRDQIGLDPETQIDRGDWLAWMFRESLLDRHLQDGED